MSQRQIGERLRASDLRHHTVTITAPAGTVEVDESTVASRVPAAITVTPPQFQVRGEQFGGGALQASTEYTVSLRYRTDLAPSFVLVEECCTQRRFQILSIVPTDRRDAVDIRCVTQG